MNFLKLGISAELNNRLKESGISKPTPIQEMTIPVLLTGKDVIAKAKTGTGKTLAFTLPMLQMVKSESEFIQGLIVTPTRELALQVTAEVKKMVPDGSGINVLAVYGGQDVEKQMKKLKGKIHIVIGTPGRLLDHLRRGTIKLSKVSMLVLDEADQMLHIGFLSEVEDIIRTTPTNRQTMLFSATMPQQVVSLAKRYMKKPQDIRVKEKEVTLKEIKQIVIETTDRAKQEALFSMIDRFQPYLAIIFCRTKRRASKLNEALLDKGYNSDELHGDLSQTKREQVMKRFREAKLQFLVATDVAARGLDVEGVTHVFNYDIPLDTDSYIHRIGRTGRAGEEGVAVTFMAPKDRSYLQLIEKGINLSLERQTIEGAPAERKGKTNVKAKPRYNKGKESKNNNRKVKAGKSKRLQKRTRKSG